MSAFLEHGFVDEQADAFGQAVGALFSDELQDRVQEFRVVLVGHVMLMLDVFGDTPTRNQCGPPSTSFSRAPLSPLRGSAALGSLRSPSLRLTPEGWGRRKERQITERVLHPLVRFHRTPLYVFDGNFLSEKLVFLLFAPLGVDRMVAYRGVPLRRR